MWHKFWNKKFVASRAHNQFILYHCQRFPGGQDNEKTSRGTPYNHHDCFTVQRTSRPSKGRRGSRIISKFAESVYRNDIVVVPFARCCVHRAAHFRCKRERSERQARHLRSRRKSCGPAPRRFVRTGALHLPPRDAVWRREPQIDDVLILSNPSHERAAPPAGRGGFLLFVN
jgi:hypothetical protein